MALKRGFALKEPARELKEIGRMIAGKRERGIDERVGFDEGTVKIDTESRKCCDLSWGGRNGQRSILPIEAVSQGLRFVRLPNTDDASGGRVVFSKTSLWLISGDPALWFIPQGNEWKPSRALKRHYHLFSDIQPI